MFYQGLAVADWAKMKYADGNFVYFNHSPGIVSIEYKSVGCYWLKTKKRPPVIRLSEGGQFFNRYPIIAMPAEPSSGGRLFEAKYVYDELVPVDNIQILMWGWDGEMWAAVDFPIEIAMYLPSASDWFSD